MNDPTSAVFLIPETALAPPSLMDAILSELCRWGEEGQDLPIFQHWAEGLGTPSYGLHHLPFESLPDGGRGVHDLLRGRKIAHIYQRGQDSTGPAKVWVYIPGHVYTYTAAGSCPKKTVDPVLSAEDTLERYVAVWAGVFAIHRATQAERFDQQGWASFRELLKRSSPALLESCSPDFQNFINELRSATFSLPAKIPLDVQTAIAPIRFAPTCLTPKPLPQTLIAPEQRLTYHRSDDIVHRFLDCRKVALSREQRDALTNILVSQAAEYRGIWWGAEETGTLVSLRVFLDGLREFLSCRFPVEQFMHPGEHGLHGRFFQDLVHMPDIEEALARAWQHGGLVLITVPTSEAVR